MRPFQKFFDRLWFLLFFLFYIPSELRSQELVFRHYGAAEGLPSSEAYCAMQDSSGYMWFGTDRGVVKFDGYDFTTLTSADGMTDNTIFGLCEDHHRRIWFNTYTAKIGFIYQGKPQTYAHNRTIKSLIKSGISKGLFYDNKDRLWICCLGSDLSEHRVQCIDSLGQVHTPLVKPEPGFKDIYVLPSGACFVHGSHKALKARVISSQNDRVLFRFPSQSSIYGQAFSFMEKDGTVWVCIAGEVWSFKNDTIVKHIEYTGDLLSFMVDEHKNVWLGFHNKGLSLYLADKKYREPIELLSAYSVSGMCFDREHGKWFTSLENGIFYLPPDLCFSYGRESGLSSAKILQLENSGGDILAVQSDFNVSVKKKGSRSFNRINLPGANIYAIRKGVADTFYYAANRSAHFSMPGKFIYIYMQSVSLTGQRVWGVGGADVRCFGRNGQVKKELIIPHIGRTTCVFEKNLEKHFLVGTIEGLYEYRDDTIRSLGNISPLFRARITGLLSLGNGVLAVATMGQGLLLVREDNYALLHQYSWSSGLPGAMCNVMLKENDSTLWIGTNKGLCRISNPAEPGRVRFQTTDVNNGLASNEITDLCFQETELWIATQNGISVLHAPGTVRHLSQPPLHIDKMFVNGTAVRTSPGSVFEHWQNNITLSFTGLNYQNAGGLRYKYRLKGADSSWKVTSARTLIYNALMPGHYIFELQAIAPNGHRFNGLTTLSFTILSPYWQSWWFVLLVVVIAATGIYGFVAYRIRYVRRQAKLQHDLDSYRDKALRAQMNPHFIYNSMNAIQNFITKNETKTSLDFLARFSRLMRLTFQNSFKDLVMLDKDLEALVLYTEMESIRFPGKFYFSFSITGNTKPDKLRVPPLLVQPFIENAILHAFPGIERTGNIRLEIKQEADRVYFEVTDDGIGRSEALSHQKKKQKYRPAEERKESGITITEARIKQAWEGKPGSGYFKITDLFGPGNNASGTRIEFYLPIYYDQNTFS